MSWTAEEAKATGELLMETGSKITVRSVRYELRERGKEWLRAARELDGCDEGEAAIELVGNIGQGMGVLGNEDEPWFKVIRVMNRDGQASIHCENPMDPRPIYRNYFGPGSPVVVRA